MNGHPNQAFILMNYYLDNYIYTFKAAINIHIKEQCFQ